MLMYRTQAHFKHILFLNLGSMLLVSNTVRDAEGVLLNQFVAEA